MMSNSSAPYSNEATIVAFKNTDKPKILSLDVIRGIALLGILLVSIWDFGGFTTNLQTYYRTGTHGGNYKLLTLVSVLFEGKVRALFSLVLGAGIILFLSKKNPVSNVSNADLYMRRQIWLMLFGILNAIILLWPGDFLFQYAVLGILLFAFWRMSPKALFIAAVICTIIYSGKEYWNYADDRKVYKKYMAITVVEKKFSKDSIERFKQDSLISLTKKDTAVSKVKTDGFTKPMLKDSALAKAAKNDTLTKEQKKDKEAWTGLVKGMKYDSTITKADNKAMRTGHYWKIWNYLLPRSQYKESTWLYKIGIWDVGSMMFLGMAFLGFGFFGNGFTIKKYWLIAIPSLVIGLLLAWLRIDDQNAGLMDYGKYIEGHAIPYNLFFPIERLLLATGYASVIMLLLRVNRLGWLWRSLAAVGRIAFTNYIVQSIICTFFFYGYGMGYYGRLTQLELYFLVAEIWLVQIVFSILWLRHYSIGPLEWVWRGLIYGKWQSMKKSKSAISAIN